MRTMTWTVPQAVGRLSAEHQLIYRLRWTEKLPIAVIMERLGMKHHTVRYRIECIRLAMYREKLSGTDPTPDNAA